MAVQAILLALFLVDWRIPIVAAVGLMVGMVLLDFPIWAVGLMLASRVISTGTLSFFSIGKIQIGLFEPVLLFTLCSLALKAVFREKLLLKTWPWQVPFFAMIGWRVLGLAWCTSFTDGLKEIIGLSIIVATTSVVLAFIESWESFKLMLWFWIGVCVLIGLLSQFGALLGIVDYSAQWAASEGGGRETGLGQQPNWFAMNLMFVIHATAAFALIQKRFVVRVGLLVASVYIFFTMMTSGSRGGAYALVIGGVLVALGQPLFRKWFLRLMGLLVFLFLIAAAGSLGDIGKGFNRISGGLDILFAKDIRGMNWQACMDMFSDTYGLGVGPGGYIELLAHYNWFIYESVYRYPHGIIWGEIAHTGVIGVILLLSLVASILRMTWATIQDTKGTEAEMLAWAMPASMFGYWAWSFVEFSIEEKPFWEWLALYTALHIVARKAKEGKLPPIPSRLTPGKATS
jgi:O-Antigen ligase